MSDVRRFDSLERTVRDARRKLDDVESTVMARLAMHTHAGGGSGSVSSVNGETGAVVLDAGDVGAEPAGAISAHTGASDPHPQYLTTAGGSAAYAPLSHNHAASAINSGTLDIARIPTGTSATTVALGNDGRFTDARTPVAHTHSAADLTSGTVASARLGTGTANDTTFLRGDGTWGSPPDGGGGGVTDHGALTGLADDDHTQYHNDARGDSRYYTKTQVDTSLVGKANTAHAHAAEDVTSGTMGIARIPTGTTATTVALGNHTHSGGGFAPVHSFIATSGTTTSSFAADLSSGGVGPAATVTIGASGAALVMFSARIAASVAADLEVAVDANAPDITRVLLIPTPTTGGTQVGISHVWTGLTPGSHTFTLKYRRAGGSVVDTITYSNRQIVVIPL